MLASDRKRAGSHPCQSARWYGRPSSPALGSVSAYPENATSRSGAANPAMSVRADRMTGEAMNPIGGSGHGVCGIFSPDASRLVQNAPQMKRRP